MSEAAHCTFFGTAIPGREKQALDVHGEALQYWERLRSEGKIERVDAVLVGPTGGDLAGFILARGTRDQMDAARRSEEYERLQVRGQLAVRHVRSTDAYVDEGLARVMGQYVDELGHLGV